MNKEIIELCQDIIALAKGNQDAPQKLIDQTQKDAVTQLMKIYQAMADIAAE